MDFSDRASAHSLQDAYPLFIQCPHCGASGVRFSALAIWTKKRNCQLTSIHLSNRDEVSSVCSFFLLSLGNREIFWKGEERKQTTKKKNTSDHR